MVVESRRALSGHNSSCSVHGTRRDKRILYMACTYKGARQGMEEGGQPQKRSWGCRPGN